MFHCWELHPTRITFQLTLLALLTLTACDLSNSRRAAEPGKEESVPTDTKQDTVKEEQSDKKEDSSEVTADDKDTRTEPGTTQKTEPDQETAVFEEHPFPRRAVGIDLPPLSLGGEWINTAGPLDFKDLRGKFVILDFWTYCCINCIHVLPELKKIEKAYPNQVVVIGVHSPKFNTEKDTQNIRDAVLRYEIEHPVVNDSQHHIWRSFGIRSWPTLLMIDPEGYAVWMKGGETTFETLDREIKRAIPYYRQQGTLDETPIRFDLEQYSATQTPLRYPGKIHASAEKELLFITDSNHNRILITDLKGKLLGTIGSGAVGSADGDFESCSFHHPQGVFLHGDTLYVADTENHLIRKVDMTSKQVTTISGTGEQSRSTWPGLENIKYDDRGQPILPDRWVATPSSTALNSPWALWVHENDLYIAMAGPHQIWKMTLDEKEIGPYAGNGRENITDGLLLPKEPYKLGYSSFAQPSGLASDGKLLYVADSEGSAIRAVPFEPDGQVDTVVGVRNTLFDFGDVDGKREDARLQHALGVVLYKDKLYVADTYNNKIKVVDPETGETKTIAGSGEPGTADDPPQFDEPSGLTAIDDKLYIADTNNHLIRVVDLKEDYKVSTLKIAGLQPPPSRKQEKKEASRGKIPGGAEVDVAQTVVRPADGKLPVNVTLQLPPGWKLNPQAPVSYVARVSAGDKILAEDFVGKPQTLRSGSTTFKLELPLARQEGKAELAIELVVYYCQDGAEGLCKLGSVTWNVPVEIRGTAENKSLTLRHALQVKGPGGLFGEEGGLLNETEEQDSSSPPTP